MTYKIKYPVKIPMNEAGIVRMLASAATLPVPTLLGQPKDRASTTESGKNVLLAAIAEIFSDSHGFFNIAI